MLRSRLCLQYGGGVRPIACAFALWMVLLASPLSVSPATAQAVREQAAPVELTQVCQVATNERFSSPAGDAKQVTAICGRHGLLLGHADAFDVIRNVELGAVLVDMRHGSDRRVLLISLQGERPPLVEDISGQISLSAGEGPLSPIGDIDVDLTGFPRTGAVRVTSRPEVNAGVAKASEIDLARQVSGARSIRGAGPPQQ